MSLAFWGGSPGRHVPSVPLGTSAASTLSPQPGLCGHRQSQPQTQGCPQQVTPHPPARAGSSVPALHMGKPRHGEQRTSTKQTA